VRQTIVVTDLTQMPDGDEVCVVGINEKGECIRPICEGGFQKKYLYAGKNMIIRPRARIEFDFTEAKIEPPHIEDKAFHPSSIVDHGLCLAAEWENILRNGSYLRVEDIFDGFLQGGEWVEPGSATKSIATLRQASIGDVELPEWEGRLRYRLSFRDSARDLFDRPVSDLAFRELVYKEVNRNERPTSDVSDELADVLKGVDRLYLRLGLARPFKKSATDEPRCYLQITGVHTFPDYLQGKSFADFLT
jgi:hypothetical protein